MNTFSFFVILIKTIIISFILFGNLQSWTSYILWTEFITGCLFVVITGIAGSAKK